MPYNVYIYIYILQILIASIGVVGWVFFLNGSGEVVYE